MKQGSSRNAGGAFRPESARAGFAAAIALLGAVVYLTGCRAVTSDASVESLPASIVAVTERHVRAWGGHEVLSPPTVRVLDHEGRGLNGVRVWFRVASGRGYVGSASVMTDITGSASTSWTLGLSFQEQVLEAYVNGRLRTTFVAVPQPFVVARAVLEVSGPDTGWRLVTLLQDATLRDLTTGAFSDRRPTPDPTGTRLAFLRNGRLHVMRVDGSDVRLVGDSTVHVDVESRLTWSSDGQWVAYADAGTHGISMVSADGSLVRAVTLPTTGRDYDPAWSPDGEHIAFARENDPDTGSWVWTVHVDGTGERAIAYASRNDGQVQSWSPAWNSGGWIAFVQRSPDRPVPWLAVASSETTLEGELYGTRIDLPDDVRLSEWSSSGDWLAITSSEGAWLLQSGVGLLRLGDATSRWPRFLKP